MSRIKTPLRWLVGVAMVFMGVMHFVAPMPFARIVPAWLPAPLALVYVSGVAEIAGGIGLQIPKLRRTAAWGLILLYIAVFPANVNMAIHRIQPEGVVLSDVALWGRLPFQLLFIAIAWWYTRPEPAALEVAK
jgi:uncharacterized membrane protein